MHHTLDLISSFRICQGVLTIFFTTQCLAAKCTAAIAASIRRRRLLSGVFPTRPEMLVCSSSIVYPLHNRLALFKHRFERERALFRSLTSADERHL